MNVLLIQPVHKAHLITPPLGLGYIASSLRNAGHKVTVEDCVLTKTGAKDIFSKYNPDVVGISSMTSSYKSAIDYIKEAKNRGITTILGGNHVTALPLISVEESGVDFGVIGEGEKTVVELVDGIEKGIDPDNIGGICYKGKLNPQREAIENIDDIAFPAWDLINPKRYPSAYHGSVAKRSPVAPVVTSRGCPFNCYFCSSIGMWGRRIRLRSIKNIVDEIEMLVNDYGIREIHFEDDNFTMSKPHAMDVCNEIINRGIDITWACPNGVRIDKLDRELLERMKKAGCHTLSFGIESGSQEILDKMNKNLNLKIVPDIVKLVKEVGINTTGFFIIGLPGETKEDIEKTISFAKNNLFDRAQFSTFTPLPGSQSFDDWVKDKDLKSIDWDTFDLLHFMSTDSLSKEDLLKLQTRAFREFYFRPRTMITVLGAMKPNQTIWVLRRAISYLVR